MASKLKTDPSSSRHSKSRRKINRAKPKSVADYIAAAPKQSQNKLREIRACIRATAPNASEGLKWSMPAYSHARILVMFAGFNRHIGFYPTPSAIRAFAKDLAKYKFAAGSIQFPLDQPLPLALIRKITAFRVKENASKDVKWKT
jgi:uncharacterized protein YdhG (YjbR/CyaY superfamily)